jgi:lantibiotic leader peptide-processing serine protease
MNRRLILSLAVVLAVGACSDQKDQSPTGPDETPSLGAGQSTSSYVISFSAATESDLADAIQKAGGKTRKISQGAGLATATSDAVDFADRLRGARGIRSVVRDKVVQWVDPNQRVHRIEDFAEPTSTGSTERFFPTQWALQAIQAPGAWALGQRGRGARVAILDGGIWDQHVDIAPNLDARRSTSFVPGKAFNTDTDPTLLWHATHVAGIVAAADNRDNLGVIGVAPEATLIGVKVLEGGSGSFGAIIEGILYAADPIREGGAGADIINMSLGATFSLSADAGTAALIAAVDSATAYAFRRGALVIASAGNGDRQGHGIDHDNGNFRTIPAQSTGVVAVSALGPVGYGLTPPIPTSDDFDRLASYSNFGTSIIDLSGPGGDFELLSSSPNNPTCTLSVNPAPPVSPTTEIMQPCWVFDMVVSSCRGTTTRNVCWVAGTSMSAPAVSGVAALVVGQRGRMNPGALLNILANSADDLAPVAVHGQGRVNALRAVQ